NAVALTNRLSILSFRLEGEISRREKSFRGAEQTRFLPPVEMTKQGTLTLKATALGAGGPVFRRTSIS
ncbi:MAG: hypothetical protein WAW37_00990, partial [Syntrophobacteraceae bacterium]